MQNYWRLCCKMTSTMTGKWHESGLAIKLIIDALDAMHEI